MGDLGFGNASRAELPKMYAAEEILYELLKDYFQSKRNKGMIYLSAHIIIVNASESFGRRLTASNCSINSLLNNSQ